MNTKSDQSDLVNMKLEFLTLQVYKFPYISLVFREDILHACVVEFPGLLAKHHLDMMDLFVELTMSVLLSRLSVACPK